MMKLINSIAFFTLLITFTSCNSNLENGFTATNLKLIKQGINTGTIDSIALKRLIADANIAMQLKEFSVMDNNPIPLSGNRHDYYSWSSYLWPNPDKKDGFPYIHKDGKINPNTDKVSDKPLLRRMVMAVQTLTLASYYTDNKEYSDRALFFLRTWFLNPESKMNPNLNFAQCTPGEKQGKPHGIIDTRWLIILINSVDMLEEMGAIDFKDIMLLKEWFKQYLDWLETSKSGKQLQSFKNNIGSWYIAQKATYALFTDQQDLAKSYVNESKKFFTIQIDSKGRVVHELHRTKSFDYSLYSINSLLSVLEVEKKIQLTTFDSVAYERKTLLTSIKYMAGFHNTDKEWPYPQITEKVISLNYEDGIDFSVYYPYDLYFTLRLAYNLFEDAELIELTNRIPNTKTNSHRANLLFYENLYHND